MRAAKCNKTLCLNAFNTSFISSFSYPMIATILLEKWWSKVISFAFTILAALNAATASIVKTLACDVLYGLEMCQGLDVKNHFPPTRDR